ncbi:MULTISPECIES: NTP transferase domain-containing protein [unclassified Haladaptatus]|uniref:NTP transferase domain-containing protein n=1 Tax=unclassified Haladaptatus TaxID=2622732 RepID=UPI00209BD808|nr:MULTISPECIES: NTP transferase domain-containing protein [unclassified Haladaptatus]MCO8245456.1 NTP transferase domain-containing protein [Haladaptatus sp. AB643]MCO8256568.1 NTP transferase domain-containing protein [Haladaptatus sp. AB618]
MCGGRGTRLDTDREKPLFEVGDYPLIGHVLEALESSQVESVHTAISPDTPETTDYLKLRDVDLIETPGEGYVSDLRTALERLSPPVLTVASDLPLLSGDAVNRVLNQYNGTAAVQVCVPATLKHQLGVSADTTYNSAGREVAPAGINIVTNTDTETMFLTYNTRYAINVNRLKDATIAETLR